MPTGEDFSFHCIMQLPEHFMFLRVPHIKTSLLTCWLTVDHQLSGGKTCIMLHLAVASLNGLNIKELNVKNLTAHPEVLECAKGKNS